MKMAFAVSERSTCLHHHVGAITVLSKQPLTEGYNSTAPGEPHCSDLGYCLKEKLAEERGEKATSGKGVDDCPVIHAEQNAIYQSSKIGTPLEGSEMYVTHQPCVHCARAISRVGIIGVKYVFPYEDKRGLDLFSRKGIKYNQINLPELTIKILK